MFSIPIRYLCKQKTRNANKTNINNRTIIRKALASDFNDFEDAIQYFSAVQLGKIDFISTRDLKDFKKSELPVLSPETTVKLLLKENN